MRFDVSSTALLSRLQSISKVIASKNSLPILDSFLFNLEGNKLTITASDAETRLVTSVDVMNAQGSGLFAVSAKILLDPLKELPEQPLTFDINDDNLEIFIHFQNGKYNFIGQKGDTYPQQKPLNDNAISIMMDAQMLLNGISRALFATADDELRPVMNGIYFDIHTDDLTFVASDGHKLVRLRNLSVKSPERASFILPKKPANLLKGLLSKEEGVICIKFDAIRMPTIPCVCCFFAGLMILGSTVPKANINTPLTVLRCNAQRNECISPFPSAYQSDFLRQSNYTRDLAVFTYSTVTRTICVIKRTFRIVFAEGRLFSLQHGVSSNRHIGSSFPVFKISKRFVEALNFLDD